MNTQAYFTVKTKKNDRGGTYWILSLLFMGIALTVLPMQVVADPVVLSERTKFNTEQSEWSDWQYQIPVKLVNRDPVTAEALPVDVTFAIFANEIESPEHEVRVVRETDAGLVEVPFQLWNVTHWDKDTDGERSRATVTGTVTFFDEAGDGSESGYLLLYGNPAAEQPVYESDLTVSGDAPQLVIDNERMRVNLHSSGQLASVEPAGSAGVIDTPRGLLHWNPGIFIPTRYWAHAWDWDPAEVVELESGPIFVMLTRSGTLPEFPELELSVTYRVFAGRPYVESATRLHLTEDIGVVALRNDQLIFDPMLFNQLAWLDEHGEEVVARFDDYEPVNNHGDILRLRHDAGYVAFFNTERNLGAATIRMDAMNSGPAGSPPVLFDHSTYIAAASALTYWFRPLVYFHVDWSRQKLIPVPEGSVYSERNLYLFFTPEDEEGALAELGHYRRAVDTPRTINIGAYPFPPAR